MINIRFSVIVKTMLAFVALAACAVCNEAAMSVFGLHAFFNDHGVTGLFAMSVVGTPSNITTTNATGVRRVVWEKKMHEDSILPSVFTALPTALKVINNEIVVEKAGVFMSISANPQDGQSVRLSMGLPLKKAPQYGPENSMLNNEDEKQLLWTELFYNEIKKSVKYHKFGYYANDVAYLKWIESYGPAVITFMQELRDMRIHQALTLRFAEELTYAPVSCAQTFNPNWIIPNLPESSLPAWDLDAPTRTNGAADAYGYYNSRTYSGNTTYAENVAAALMAASGTGALPKNKLNLDTLWYISEYTQSVLRIRPIMIDGRATYILLVPPRVATWMKNRNNAGSVGQAFEAMADYKDPNRLAIPGEWGRLCGNLLIVENFRAPTFTVGGAAGSYTIQPGYLAPGDVDYRNNANWSSTSGSTNYVFDMVIGLGENALAELTVDPMVTGLQESTGYGQIQGRGAYLGQGIQLPIFDKDVAGRLDGASKTAIYRGSFLVPIGRLPRVTVV